MATGLIKLSQAFQTLLTSTPEKTSLMLRPGDVHGSPLLLSPLDRIAHWKDCLAAGIGILISLACCAKQTEPMTRSEQTIW